MRVFRQSYWNPTQCKFNAYLVKMHQTVCSLKVLLLPCLSHSIIVTEGLSKPASVYVMRLEALFDPLKSYWILRVSIWASLLQMVISANVTMWKFYCVALPLNVKSSLKAWWCQMDYLQGPQCPLMQILSREYGPLRITWLLSWPEWNTWNAVLF